MCYTGYDKTFFWNSFYLFDLSIIFFFAEWLVEKLLAIFYEEGIFSVLTDLPVSALFFCGFVWFAQSLTVNYELRQAVEQTMRELTIY